MLFDLELVRSVYQKQKKELQRVRALFKRPLTLTEKILYMHVKEFPQAPRERGKDYVEFLPDRVAMQDATAQMALLQLMIANPKKAHCPSTVHCDHLIQAEFGAASDLARSKTESKEVYEF